MTRISIEEGIAVPDFTQLDCQALEFRVRQLLCTGLGDHSIAAMTGLDVDDVRRMASPKELCRE
jgi:hypothetical protein